MTDEELADWLEIALARRPDRVASAAFDLLAPEARAHVVALQRELANLPLAEAAATPSPSTRTRILASIKGARAVRRAVVVVDMINDHLTPGRILEVPRARAIVPALVKRIADARRDGVPIVYVVDQHDPNDSDLDDWGEHAVRGSEGAKVWPALAPEPNDRIVTKPSYSSFFRSNLEAVLTELGVDTIELTGCSTEVQLLSTATDAMQLGFAVEVSPTLQAGTTEESEHAAMRTMQFLIPYKPARESRLRS